jgi:hypothetical protein
MIPVSIELVLDPASPIPATEVRLGFRFGRMWEGPAFGRRGDLRRGRRMTRIKWMLEGVGFVRSRSLTFEALRIISAVPLGALCRTPV